MFGLIRLPILLLLAFGVGIFFERGQAATACTEKGGAMVDGICRGVSR